MLQKVGTDEFDSALLAAAQSYDLKSTIWTHAAGVVKDKNRFLCAAILHWNLFPASHDCAWSSVRALASQTSALPEFVKSLLDNPETSHEGRHAIQTFPATLASLVDYVGERLGDPKLEWPISAIEMFGEEARPYRDKILPYLATGRPYVYACAARALEKLGDYTAVELDTYFQHLSRPDNGAVLNTLQSLADRYPEVRARLLEQLDSSVPFVRLSVCTVFQRSKIVTVSDQARFQELIEDEQDLKVLDVAAQVAVQGGYLHTCFDAVFKHLEPEEKPRYEGLRRSLRAEARTSSPMLSAIRAKLAAADEPQDICNLLSLLFDPSMLSRSEPLVLSKVSLGLEYLDHPSSKVASAAWMLLGQGSHYPLVRSRMQDFQRERIVEKLDRICTISDRRYALQACRGLKLKGEKVAQFVRHSLCSADPAAQVAACEAISEQAWREHTFLPLLKGRLRSQNPAIAKSAATALVWYGEEGLRAIEARRRAGATETVKEKFSEIVLVMKPAAVRRVLAGNNEAKIRAVVQHLDDLAAHGAERLRGYLSEIYLEPKGAPSRNLTDLMNILLEDLSGAPLSPWTWTHVARLVWNVGPPAANFAPLLVEKGLSQEYSSGQRIFVGALGSLGAAAYEHREFVRRFLDSPVEALAETARDALNLIYGTPQFRSEAELNGIASELKHWCSENQLMALRRAASLPDAQLASLATELLDLVRLMSVEVTPDALKLCGKIVEKKPEVASFIQLSFFDPERPAPPAEIEQQAVSIAVSHYKLFQISPQSIRRGLASSSPAVREGYAELVGKYALHTDYMELLYASALQRGSEVYALWALTKYEELPDSVCEGLARYRGHADTAIRFSATRALIRAASVETRHAAAEDLAKYLGHDDVWYAQNAVGALAEARSLPESLLPLLLGQLQHRDQTVRYFVANTLAHFLPQLGEYVPRLTYLASQDDYPYSRNQIIWLVNNATR
jgi:hypothetical protein